MAPPSNYFALLGDDDDGSGDVAAIIARVEAMVPPPPPKQQKPKGGNHLPPADHVGEERVRGRGDMGRGRGSGQSAGRQNGYSGQGRGGGAGGFGGGRGRGRGRDSYQGRHFANVSPLQDFHGGNSLEEGTEAQGKNYGYVGGLRRIEGRGGRAYGIEGRGFRGGMGQMYRPRDVRQRGMSEAGSANGKEQAVDKDGSGRGMPETTKMPKDAEKIKPEQVVSEKTSKNDPQEEADNSMTLDEYEKLLHEKRKALEALKAEERKVVDDKEFDGMERVAKKKDEIFVKLNSEKDNLKKKDSPEKEEKLHKPVSINEFLKDYGRGRGGRGRGRGAYMGGFSGQIGPDQAPALSIEDQGQFPLLGGGGHRHAISA